MFCFDILRRVVWGPAWGPAGILKSYRSAPAHPGAVRPHSLSQLHNRMTILSNTDHMKKIIKNHKLFKYLELF